MSKSFPKSRSNTRQKTRQITFTSEDNDVVYTADDTGVANCIRFNINEIPKQKPVGEPEHWVPAEKEVLNRMDHMCSRTNVDLLQCSFQQERALQLSEDGHTVAFSAMVWDKNMAINKHLIWRKVRIFDPTTKKWACVLDEHGFTVQGTSRLTRQERRAFSKVFSLAKNGCGLIDTSCERPNKIVRHSSRFYVPTVCIGGVPIIACRQEGSNLLPVRQCLRRMGTRWAVLDFGAVAQQTPLDQTVRNEAAKIRLPALVGNCREAIGSWSQGTGSQDA